mmetsp:Transcript_8628/g.12880  ORF Transcript_8628/g.12880 Transcript_8628/m.12880 type:complete len:84 (+) Transcript_8628:3-254(+)
MPKSKITAQSRKNDRQRYENAKNEGIRRSIFGNNKGSVKEALRINREERMEAKDFQTSLEEDRGTTDNHIYAQNENGDIFSAK